MTTQAPTTQAPATQDEKEYTFNYFCEHPWDSSYDSEQSASIFASSMEAATETFREDYGESQILSAYEA